jgi:hypothetical protein
MKLQAAKEILAEVSGAPPGEVEEMIQRRMKERSRTEEDWKWPGTFVLGVAELSCWTRGLMLQALKLNCH